MVKKVLGVKIDDVSLNEAVLRIEKWVHSGGKHSVFTPNPEMLVIAQKDKEFKDILNKSDMSIPDGVGLKIAGVKNRTTGTDLMKKLISLSNEKGFVISFLGGQERVAEKLVERLKRLYQNISIVPPGAPADLLFVAFGAPKQEKWIAQNLQKIPVNIAIGVGGAFDYLSGRVPRAPGWVRGLGLEWLFRLIIQPWRIKRQFALIEYLWLLTKEGLKR